MKSKTATKQEKEKGFFRKVGEVIGNIGHELVEGKDKVVAASQTIVKSIASPGELIKKKQAKKKPVKKAAAKVAKKKVTQLTPIAVKAVKKFTKKSPVKKSSKKKTATPVKK